MRRLPVLIASLFLVILVAAGPLCGASLPLPDHPHYVFQHVGDDLGMGSITAVSLKQDRTGFLWIGTQDGLLRYDGARVRRYVKDAPSTFIDQIEQTPDGSIWIGTRKGVARLANDSFIPLVLPAGAHTEAGYQEFGSDKHGNFYIATDKGLLRLDPARPSDYKFWSTPEGLPDPRIEAVFVASDGTAWFASAHRIGHVGTGGNATMLPADAGVPNERVIAILVDPSGRVWVRTSTHLARRDPGSLQFVLDDTNLPNANDFGIPALDCEGNIVVPTVAGLYRKVDGHWELVDEHRGMAANATFAVTEDREHAYWIALGGAGLERWPGMHTWLAWTEAEGLPDNVVWAIVRDQQKRLWVGTNHGLAMWDAAAHQWRVWNERSGLNGSTVRQIAVAKDGGIWVLCYPGGITRFDPSTLVPEHVSTPQPDPTTVQLAPDGRMWIGNASYLKAVRSNSRPYVLEDVNVPAGIIGTTSHMNVAPDGTLWSGGPNGLSRFDGKGWVQFTKKDGLRSDTVQEVAPASANEVWFAYDESKGLGRLQIVNGAAKVRHYDTGDGLPSEGVYMLGYDRAGNVWAGTGEGVTRITPDGQLRNFTRSDGLIWNDPSSFAFLAEEDGSVMIGTSGGLARFDAHAAPEADLPKPTVVITAAEFGGQDRLGEKNPEAAHRDNTFRAEFAALTFRDPSQVVCWYRLAGLESQFTETRLREARYPALPRGDYRFEVFCRSAAGVMSAPAAFSFHIAPAWWERWPFRGFILVIAVWLLFAFIRWRTGRLEEDRRRLEAAVAERSAELARANLELQEASLTDPLTGVRNRRYFNVVVESDVSQAVRNYASGTTHRPERNRDLVFYIIDVDFFKEINDRYGHHAGDTMLVEITRRIASVMRQSDVLIRWGGEEFLVVSRQAERLEAGTLARRILHAIGGSPYFVKPGERAWRTCSVGWAPFPWYTDAPENLRYEEVLKLADRALYLAKESGRNQAIGLVATSKEPATMVPQGGWKDSATESERMPADTIGTPGPEMNDQAADARAASASQA